MIVVLDAGHLEDVVFGMREYRSLNFCISLFSFRLQQRIKIARLGAGDDMYVFGKKKIASTKHVNAHTHTCTHVFLFLTKSNKKQTATFPFSTFSTAVPKRLVRVTGDVSKIGRRRSFAEPGFTP